MDYKQFPTNHVRNREGVKRLIGHREELVAPVLSGAFVVEAVDTVNWLRFVIATGHEK